MIKLEISADTAEELINTINGLATLGGRAPAATPAKAEAVAEEADEVEERPQTEAPKTRRRRNTETAGAPNAGSEPDTSASAGPASDASPETTSGATVVKPGLVGDDFSKQMKEAREASDDSDVVTIEVVQQAFAKACAPGGKMSMREAQELLRANFTQANGEPVRRIAEIQPKDYAAVVKKLEG